MPKNKREVKEESSSSSSDSDSGPEDRNPPPSKKAKEETKSSSPKPKSKVTEKSDKNDDKKNEKRWTLEKLRFINVKEFKGRKSIDIRQFYEKDGEQLPSKRGISLSIPQWKKLLELADEVTAAAED